MISVFCCGSNGRGQLGLGDEEDYDYMREVQLPEIDGNIVDIACGGNHTIILTSNNSLYSSGDDSMGQLGGRKSNTFVKWDGKWKLVSCGWEFTVLVDISNNVFVCGSGPKGELGLGAEVVQVNKLTQVSFEFPDDIVSLKSSVRHTVLQLANGELYGWGVSRHGQLGPNMQKITWIPKKIETNFEISCIGNYALGRDYTVIYNSNKLQILGPIEKFPGVESEFLDTRIRKIHAMWSSIHLEDEENRLISYGNNRHNQLLTKSNSLHWKEQNIQVSTGSEHGLVQINDKVMAWGWGEHGNCGKLDRRNDLDSDSTTKQMLNEVFTLKQQDCKLYCGCASSWIVLTMIR